MPPKKKKSVSDISNTKPQTSTMEVKKVITAKYENSIYVCDVVKQYNVTKSTVFMSLITTYLRLKWIYCIHIYFNGKNVLAHKQFGTD